MLFRSSQCDGEWEHKYGVTIQTLDNPGWMVQIDLTGTTLENASMEAYSTSTIRNGTEQNPDWISVSVKDRKFVAASGPGSLERICNVFQEWAEKHRVGG